MDEPHRNSWLRIAWKIAIVAAVQVAATISFADDGTADSGGLRSLLAEGWRQESGPASSPPVARIVRPAAHLINAIPPSVLSDEATGCVESCGALAQPTMFDLIRQRSPVPQARIVRPAVSPLRVPLPSLLRVAEPIELESLTWDDEGIPEPVTLEQAPQVYEDESPSPAGDVLQGMLFGEGLAVDPY
jgi:hypothetical protein